MPTFYYSISIAEITKQPLKMLKKTFQGMKRTPARMAVAVAGAAAAEFDEFWGRAPLLEPWLGAIQLQRQCNVRT